MTGFNTLDLSQSATCLEIVEMISQEQRSMNLGVLSPAVISLLLCFDVSVNSCNYLLINLGLKREDCLKGNPQNEFVSFPRKFGRVDLTDI